MTLRGENLTVAYYGDIYVLREVEIEARSGIITCVIGPNGAGKSTFINVLSGIYALDDGEIQLDNTPIHRLPPPQRARMGVGRTFQTPRIFHRLTVIENVLVPVAHLDTITVDVRKRATDLLELVNLADKANGYARELSGGQQKLLELARALMAEPRIVLMDEPFAGVHPELRETLIEAIKTVNRDLGTTFLIVSHEMPVVAALCQWVYAMHLGRNFLAGPAQEVLHDARLVDIYLGEES